MSQSAYLALREANAVDHALNVVRRVKPATWADYVAALDKELTWWLA